MNLMGSIKVCCTGEGVKGDGNRNRGIEYRCGNSGNYGAEQGSARFGAVPAVGCADTAPGREPISGYGEGAVVRLSARGIADGYGHVLAFRERGSRCQEQDAQLCAVIRLLDICLVGFCGRFAEQFGVDISVSDLCNRLCGAVDRVCIRAEPLSPAEPDRYSSAGKIFRGVLLIEVGAVCAGAVATGGCIVAVIDLGAEVDVQDVNLDIRTAGICRADAVEADRLLAGQGQIIAVNGDIRIAVLQEDGIICLRADVSDHAGCGAFIQRGTVGGDFSGYGEVGDGCSGNVGKSADDTACRRKSVLEKFAVTAVVCGG